MYKLKSVEGLLRLAIFKRVIKAVMVPIVFSRVLGINEEIGSTGTYKYNNKEENKQDNPPNASNLFNELRE